MGTDLDRTRPYGTIMGHSVAHYEQGGLLFNAQGKLIGTPDTVDELSQQNDVIVTDLVASGMEFLRNLLRQTAMSKASVYKQTELEGFNWDAVKSAAVQLGIHKFKYNKAEMWKLPETEDNPS